MDWNPEMERRMASLLFDFRHLIDPKQVYLARYKKHTFVVVAQLVHKSGRTKARRTASQRLEPSESKKWDLSQFYFRPGFGVKDKEGGWGLPL